MKINNMHWQQVEDYLQHDDRAVIPLGSTEQHAYLSLSVDSILSSRIAAEAAEPLGIPVFPVLAYGLTPQFTSYPGTVSLRMSTYLNIIGDLLDGLAHSGFRRIVFVNGHGGNRPAQAFTNEWMGQNRSVQVKFHNWWDAPQVWAKVQSIDPVASHASWMENFPWTRLADIAMPNEQKPMIDFSRLDGANPDQIRADLGDGNFGGLYQRPDEDMLAIWEVGVAETRAVMAEGWR
ncbi:MAG: creatininase family protein [Chloroflexota bacterium]